MLQLLLQLPAQAMVAAHSKREPQPYALNQFSSNMGGDFHTHTGIALRQLWLP